MGVRSALAGKAEYVHIMTVHRAVSVFMDIPEGGTKGSVLFFDSLHWKARILVQPGHFG